MYQKRNPVTEAAAVRRFIETAGRAFSDLQPRPGDTKAVREALHCSALLRRIRLCEEAGIARMFDSETQCTVSEMERDLTQRLMRAMQ